MEFFNGIIMPILSLIGGLSLFLFGMKTMGHALELCAGNQLKGILARLTSNKWIACLLGVAVTALIQSSGATTVMVVGFVNSGVMTLSQATGVTLGANLGTSATAWLLSLSGVSGGSSGLWVLSLFKPATFVPILGLVGIILYMFQKKQRRRNYGLILLGFAVLMYGMTAMSDAMKPIIDRPAIQEAIKALSNPFLGLLFGFLLTALLQSSSATVGVLQAMSLTGAITVGITVPFLNGANIGACIVAMMSSVGASKDARRAALVNLYFNILSAILCMGAFYGARAFLDIDLAHTVSTVGIATFHSGFKLFSLLFFLPASRLLELLADKSLADKPDEQDRKSLLDDRLIGTPVAAIGRARTVTEDMAELAIGSLRTALTMLNGFSEKTMEKVYADEEQVDKYEDALGTYLVKIGSSRDLSGSDSREVTKLLHLIGDFERISDHAVNIAESAQEMMDKKLAFSEQAIGELNVLISAIDEITQTAVDSFCTNNTEVALHVEPLEEVVDSLIARLKKRHVERLQRGECTIELGFILSDLLTNLERVSDHCSNVAGCVIEIKHNALDVHEYLEKLKTDGNEQYIAAYEKFRDKYQLPARPVSEQV